MDSKKTNTLECCFFSQPIRLPGISFHRSAPNPLINKGIRDHRQFSINIPSQTMRELTDYAGLFTGSKVSKAELEKIDPILFDMMQLDY